MSERFIEITEVGPRDGLQNIEALIDPNAKIEFVNELSKTGLKRIEVSAFVNPTWVPQLADAAHVLHSIERQEGVLYTALVPNEHGWIRSLESSIDEIGVLTAASDAFCEKNINTTIDGSVNRFIPLIKLAHEHSKRVRCYISCSIACPYSGKTDKVQLRDLTARLLDLGVDDIDFGDTIGVALPEDILRMYDTVDGVISPSDSIIHLHNTNGAAIDCAKCAIECGVWRFDSSCGGLGGCPYAPGAAGNISTESLVTLAEELGFTTGIDQECLGVANNVIQNALHDSD